MSEKTTKRKVLAMSGDWRLNADVDNTHAFWYQDWHRYSAGYLEAAQATLAHLKEHPRQRDFLVYPVVFLFRHYLELRLKEIILRAGLLQAEDEKITRDHGLLNLWNRARPRIERAFPNDDRTPLDRIEGVIKEIDALDSDSMRFRYPVTLKGEPAIKGIRYINPVEFASKIDETIEILNGVAEALLVYLDYKSEYGGNEWGD
jgi:hypothetical protein